MVYAWGSIRKGSFIGYVCKLLLALDPSGIAPSASSD